MLQVLSLHHSHDGSYTQTVVATQGGLVGTYPVTVDDGLDWVVLEVVVAFRSLLRHHIHVCLHDNTLSVLHAWSSRFAHHDVSGSILESLYASFLCPVEQISLNFLQMS